MVQRTKNQNTLDIGGWNAECDRCGFKFKNSDLKRTWDGLYVCKDDWEPRHPSDFQTGHKDDPSVPWTRPESADASGTDIEGSGTGFIGNPVNVGDVNKTLTIDTDPLTQIWNTELTSNRTVTLSTSNAVYGDRFTIYRNATTPGSFTLDVGGLQTIPADVNGVAVVEYNGAAWRLVTYYTLGL